MQNVIIKHKTILHVEDNLDVQHTLQRVLRDTIVVAVASVPNAIAMLLNIKFDAVVTDYNLIGPQTGGDLIKWIAENLPHMLEKTFLFTGNDDAADTYPRTILKPDVMAVRTALASVG